ncbi:MAG: zf-HC2 domain-containing protein [Treponema sp.]|nr:zf-HC2 domain-containing protein [Treponema sp.]
MFTCPNKDLHSVYLDGELAEEYKAKYEEHIKTCPKCQAELKKLEVARELLKADSDSISMSKRDMESSFARLQSRMSYKRVLKPLSLGDGAKNVLKDVLVGSAAAAVIAAVIPAKTKTVVQPEFKPVARMSSLNMPTDLQLEGAASPASVVGFLSNENSHEAQAVSAVPFASPVLVSSPEVDVSAPTLANTAPVSSVQSLALTSYDVFLPVESEASNLKEKQSGFFLHLSSPLFTIDIGKEE